MNKSDGKVKIELQGPKGDEDSLRLDDFVDFLQTIKTGLHHIEHITTKNPSTLVQYRVTDLSHASPFKLTLEPYGTSSNLEELSQKVIATFIGTINSIENGEEVQYLDDPTLEIIKKIGKKRMESFSHIVIGNCDSSTSVSDSLEKKADTLIAIERETIGSVFGMLDSLTVHNSANKFAIYPQTSTGKIECKFPSEMFEKAKEGLGRYVKVVGNLKYKGNARFPSRVAVHELSIMPKEEDIPSFKSLLGKVPDLTGGKSTADFIRSIREEDE